MTAADEADEHAGVSAGTPLPQAVGGQLATEQGVYGVILVAGLIVVGGMDVANALATLVTVVSTVLVFWAAHVFAGAVAHGTAHERRSVAHAFRFSLRKSWGLLVATLIPAAILLLGTAKVVPDDVAIWTALWVCVALLAVLGYAGFRRRGARTAVCLAGAACTAAFGLVMVVLKVALH